MQTNINKHNNIHAVWWHLNSRSPTAPVFEVTVAVFLDLEVCTNVQVTWLKIKQNLLEKDHSPGDGGHFHTITWHAYGDVPLDRAWCFCFPVKSVSPTSGLHVHRRTERSRKTRQNDWKQAKRKAGRPNVLWAKIYTQRESNWEWPRSPMILLRATHNQSHVHIGDLKQIAAASSTSRSWMQRPGESTSL